MPLHRATRYTLALSLLALPAVAGAQAFGLNEIGSCALARGFAATSAPCDDASTIYWNPGAMPSARGLSIYGGLALINIKGDFTRDTSGRVYPTNAPLAKVPHVFINYRGSGALAYGIGLYVPYGLTSQWPDSFPGRFSASKASLATVYVQPNISYQVNDQWSVGGGPVFGHSTVELIQALDLSQYTATVVNGQPVSFGQLGIPLHTEFGRANLKGSANAVGFNVGAHGQLNPNWQMGVRFLSQLTFQYDDADASFTQTLTGIVIPATLGTLPAGTQLDTLLAKQYNTGGALTPQKVHTTIQHPAQVQLGFAYTGFANTTLSAEYSYVGWKSFKTLPVEFQGSAPVKYLQEDYNNTSGFRLGAERRTSSGMALRGGFMATAAAAPDETVTPLLPEQDRALASLGIGMPFGGRFAFDAGYAHVFGPGRRGRLDERAPNSTTAQAIALNNGSYSLSANIFSLSLKAAF